MSNDIVDILQRSFPQSKFEILQEKFGGDIYSFFILSNNQAEIEKNWENIRNKVGVYFQSKLHSEFEVWNLYLFFITSEPVNKDLKHKIEHDTVSSRKIVIENYQGELNNDRQKELFKKHIAFDNITEEVKDDIEGVEKNSIINDALNKIQVPSKKMEQSGYMGLVLKEIEKSLKNEI